MSLKLSFKNAENSIMLHLFFCNIFDTHYGVFEKHRMHV